MSLLAFAGRSLRLERLEDRFALSGFGTEDGAYIIEPWKGSYEDVKIQPNDQKIVAAGTDYTSSTGYGVGVARYDAAGNSDVSYGVGGVARPNLGPSSEAGLDLVLQPDGKAIVSGDANGPNNIFGVERLNVDGSPDAAFGSGGWSTLNAQTGSAYMAYGVGLQSTGKVVTAGVNVVGRFTASGAIDSGKGGFGTVTKGKATGYTVANSSLFFADLAVQADDKIVTAGSLRVSDAPSTYALAISRYTASGASDTSFNGNGQVVFLPSGIEIVYARCVALQSDGKIVAAGYASQRDGYGDMFVARFNANGTLDTSFGGGAGYVSLDIDGTTTATREGAEGLLIQPDGKIVVVGTAGSSSIPTSVLVARLNTNGTLDQSFGAGGFKLGLRPADGYHSFDVAAGALQADGSIIVVGQDNRDSTAVGPNPFLMRFSGASNALLAASSVGSATNDTALLSLLGEDLDLAAGKKKRL